MYRLTIINSHTTNSYRWYNDPQTAHLVASIIVKNKDAERVEIYNCKEKFLEAIYTIR